MKRDAIYASVLEWIIDSDQSKRAKTLAHCFNTLVWYVKARRDITTNPDLATDLSEFTTRWSTREGFSSTGRKSASVQRPEAKPFLVYAHEEVTWHGQMPVIASCI